VGNGSGDWRLGIDGVEGGFKPGGGGVQVMTLLLQATVARGAWWWWWVGDSAEDG
jgi:hypothetical protein